MNSSVDDYEFDCEEEIFDEIESPSTYVHYSSTSSLFISLSVLVMLSM